ncbi:hypothetical protein KSP39_PZI017488 [Platanthera zijinensis]|uniref:Ribosomal protein L34e superfamily protein n=1 Tax=Platanthera zijinensis TaxID=2320716 RepID=A0AAP0B7D2_9ASPA
MIHHHHPLTGMPSSPDSSPNRRRLSNSKSSLSSPLSSQTCFPSSSCNHSPSAAAFDLLILIIVLLSCTFLITSSFLHIFRSLSHLLLISASSIRHDPLPFLAGFILLLVSIIAALEISCYRACVWSRRCDNRRCRGLRKAMEFDVQLQTEDCIRFISSGSVSASAATAAWKEIDQLPWKGGQQGNNPDYECLRAELRQMAPPNGRAVLLFRSRCGCPIAKLEAWSHKRGRRHKKVTTSLTLESGGTQ